MSGRTRTRNQARLVRCSAGCGTLVWLKGALPVAADAEFVCATCTGGCPTAGCVRRGHADEFHVLAGTPEADDYLADRTRATS